MVQIRVRVIIKLGAHNEADLLGADRGGHEGFSELTGECVQSADFVRSHAVSVYRPQMTCPPSLNLARIAQEQHMCGGRYTGLALAGHPCIFRRVKDVTVPGPSANARFIMAYSAAILENWQKDSLLDEISRQLRQKTTCETLFIVRWRLV